MAISHFCFAIDGLDALAAIKPANWPASKGFVMPHAEASPKTVKAPGLHTSDLFMNLAAELDGERVFAGQLVDHLAGRGVGILLLIFSLPLCVPNIPGISTLFGLLLIAPSLQMIMRRPSVWMPEFARHWHFASKDLRNALRLCGKLLRKIEVLARPRLVQLTQGPAAVYAGVQTLIMALVLLLPMPGANVIPGVAVALTGLALLQKDGVFMIFSTLVALCALAWVYFGAKYIVAFAVWLYAACGHLLNGLA